MSLPAIRADACLPALYPVSGCLACAEACPRGALLCEDGDLTLDPDACSACGACAAACPAGAIALDGKEAPAPLDRPGAAGWLVCPRHPGADGDALCLQALGLAALARLWLGGLRRLSCVTADCAACPDGKGLDLQARVETLNGLLESRGLPGLALDRASRAPAGATRIGPAETAQKAGRRRLFGLSTRPAGTGTAPLAQLQARDAGPAARHAFVPRIDPMGCTGCDACIRSCPAAALSLIKDETGDLCYGLDPASCTGCGLCSDMCAQGAIRIDRLASAPPPVALRSYRCSSCGVEVHEPAGRSDSALCPICRNTRHHAKLFQVIA